MDTSEHKPPVKLEDNSEAVALEAKSKLEEARDKMEQARRKMEEKIKAKELQKEQEAAAAPKEEEVDDDVDPLDAFMMGVNEEVKKINQSERKRVKGGDTSALVEEDGEGPQV